MEYLVEKGADVHATSRLGQSTVDMARGGHGSEGMEEATACYGFEFLQAELLVWEPTLFDAESLEPDVALERLLRRDVEAPR